MESVLRVLYKAQSDLQWTTMAANSPPPFNVKMQTRSNSKRMSVLKLRRIPPPANPYPPKQSLRIRAFVIQRQECSSFAFPFASCLPSPCPSDGVATKVGVASAPRSSSNRYARMIPPYLKRKSMHDSNASFIRIVLFFQHSQRSPPDIYAE